jgi:hypothetical protein
VGSIAVGMLFGVGPGILVLAAGMLVSVIGLMWASLRTLGGDAPLAEGLAEASAQKAGVSDADEKKRRVLRALKDLEHEHAVGKIDDDDYAEVSARYRNEAKEILRAMDADIEPFRARAEAMAQAHLTGEKPAPVSTKAAAKVAKKPSAPPPSARRACAKCSTSNEEDATFCKKCGASLTPAEDSAHA